MTKSEDAGQPGAPGGDGVVSTPRRIVRFCWRGFRVCVRSGYGLVALVGYIFLHLAFVGLPSFLKEPLRREIERQRLELDYSRIRFLPTRGIVAEQVNVHLLGDPDRRPFLVQELGIRFDWMPLFQLESPRLAAVTFTGGSAARAVNGGPGEPAAVLRLEHLAGELEFSANDEWRLTWLTADLNGLTLEAMGSVSHVARYLRSRSGSSSSELTDFRSPPLARVLNGMDSMVFTDPPRVELQFAVNGEQLQRSVVQFRCTTSGAKAAFGQFDDVRLSVDVQPARASQELSHGIIRFQSAAARTRWGALDSLRFRSDAEFVPTNVLPESVRWTLATDALLHEAGRLGRLRIAGTTVLTNRTADSNAIPSGLDASRAVARREAPGGWGLSTDLQLRADDFHSRWMTVSNLVLVTHVWNATNDWIPRAVDWRLTAKDAAAESARTLGLDIQGSALPVARADQPAVVGFWTNAAPWRVQARFSGSDLRVNPAHAVDRLGMLLDWQGGTLRLTGLDARLPAGAVSGSAWLDAVKGDTGLEMIGFVEPLRMEPMLSSSTWQQVVDLGIRAGSRIDFDLHAVGRMPPATVAPDQVLGQVLPSVSAHGVVGSTNLAIAGLSVERLQIPFEFTPGFVRIAGLNLVVPPGQLTADLDAGFETGRWHVHLDESLNPLDFAPLVRSHELMTQFNLIGLTQAPLISGDAWGNWNDPGQTGASLRVALTNATYRHEPITELRTAVAYTNQQLVFTGIELFQGTNEARVPVLHYDMPAQLLYITNGFSTLNPASVVRAIGPRTASVLAPYQFIGAPTVRINGSIPVMDDLNGSVTFQATVPRLQWWYLDFDNLLATVSWTGTHISITNVAGGFYGGLLGANVEVDASKKEDAVFQFNASYTDVDLQRLVGDLSMDTNQLEGVLSGEVTVLEGHSDEVHPWSGFGNAQLRNGYLWNLPLFGMLSPAFNTVSPGLGAAKFRDGNALFNITNRSVNFKAIELLSPAMRLQIRGPVDFDGRLKLVLEAEPLRDVPLFGPLVNLVLSPFTKLMEYDLTGTLSSPEAELRHVPSFLLIPLQPFQTLKSVFGGTPAASKDPPPPVKP